MLALTKTAYNQDIFFVLLLVSFLLISIIKGIYWKHSKLFFLGIFAQRYANQFLREENAFTERVSFFTFFLMLINITLFIAKLLVINDLRSLMGIFFAVFTFYIVKIIVIKSLGALFKVSDLSKLAIFFSFLFDKTFGLILFPILLLFYFLSFDITYAIFITSIFLFVLIFILKLFWLWKIGSNSFGIHRVYIFLYLCILELFPILLLVKRLFY